jgi:hypothetical protein
MPHSLPPPSQQIILYSAGASPEGRRGPLKRIMAYTTVSSCGPDSCPSATCSCGRTREWVGGGSRVSSRVGSRRGRGKVATVIKKCAMVYSCTDSTHGAKQRCLGQLAPTILLPSNLRELASRCSEHWPALLITSATAPGHQGTGSHLQVVLVGHIRGCHAGQGGCLHNNVRVVHPLLQLAGAACSTRGRGKGGVVSDLGCMGLVTRGRYMLGKHACTMRGWPCWHCHYGCCSVA